jgi:hypothetical protein
MTLNLPDKDRFRYGELARAIHKHVATIWRWTQRGVKGQVLRSFRVGGQRYVARQDFLDFIGAINATEPPAHRGAAAAHPKSLDSVDQALDRAGF